MIKQKKPKDFFVRTAITFLLGVLVGFFIFLMGFVFLFMALLSTQATDLQVSTNGYLTLGFLSLIIGALMIRYYLGSAPRQGSYQ